ncbi:MAG: M64 family metallopeptidase [Bdellovibrionia bacterium]
MKPTVLAALFLTLQAQANPYWDPNAVPQDVQVFGEETKEIGRPVKADGLPALRIEIAWTEQGETYSLARIVKENSGTQALAKRASKADPLGSYHAILKDPRTRRAVYFDAIGTGKEYRRLTRSLSFRFPMIQSKMILEVYAENPVSGIQEKVLEAKIDPARAAKATKLADQNFEVRVLKGSTSSRALRLNVYSDGYTANRKAEFWTHAQKVVTGLEGNKFPGFEQFEIRAVFLTSNERMPAAKNLGMPVPELNTALGLFYPYWDNFGRWFNVVYPTRENKLRTGFGTVGYDYPIVLIDDADYWGVGNYKMYTAIPALHGSFTYLLLHELGHFFGLNEEYEGGGRTELEFAPKMSEPWSQNITFLRSNEMGKLKWNKYVIQSTKLPTPVGTWNPSKPLYGAYFGGYADSPAEGTRSHKPGRACTMERDPRFCPVCQEAIKAEIVKDTGRSKN